MFSEFREGVTPLFYYPLFFARRFFYIYVLVVLVEYKVVQVVLNIVHSVLFTLYVIICMPHENRSAKWINVIGEITVLFAFIGVAGFLDDSDNEWLSIVI